MEIEVLGPDVNRSDADFTVVDGKIHIGLCAIKGCGSSAMEALVAARRSGGNFADLFDFCERVDPSQISRATIETLIKAGAVDSLGATRAQSMAVLERALQSGAALHADRKSGQKGLFDALGDDDADRRAPAALPEVPPWDDRQRLAAEKEVLGFYLDSHPLAEHEKKLASFRTHDTTELSGLAARSEVVLGGMISAIKFSQTKQPRAGSSHTKYAMFDLEDMSGTVRCIVWPEDFAAHGHLLQNDATLVVKGAVDRRPGSDEPNVIVNELIPLSDLDARFTRRIDIRVSEQQHAVRALEELFEIVRGYPGNCELQLVVCLADGSRAYLKSQRVRVDLNAEMRSRVDALLGPGNLRLVAASPSTGGGRSAAPQGRTLARR
jgi:DNA polymerase-3 subunit alpha